MKNAVVMALDSRNELVSKHATLPLSVARALVYRRRAANLELDDLVSAGNLGLIDAAARYDESRGVPFKYYARRRVQGAMLDFLRDEDPLSRRERAKEKRRQQVQPDGLDCPAGSHLRLVRLDEANEKALEGHSEWDPYDACEFAQDVARLRKAVHELPERERLAVSLYYSQGMTMRAAGVLLLVSEARVCQILRAATARLRNKLCG